MRRVLKGFMLAGLTMIATSCVVSTKKYNALNAELMRTESGRVLLLEQVERQQDTIMSLQNRLSMLASQKAELDDKYNQLMERYERYLADNSAEATRMLRELQTTQEQLAERERAIAELEQMLRNREAALNLIRQKVADALLGFEGKGLTVTQRDGKVYVSMDEKLLFRSGSFTIEPEGANAVRELANVLAQNPDINVLVEGHTDNVAYRGSGNLQDNLDLSVKRATTVTRLLLENKSIDPVRITSAGRGEYLPLYTEDTAEARQKNRRTEIILTPKLDELLQIIDVD
ncbi:MAG: OmpA family protein [Rikenellaceae bacterium]|nr:OmpA family protein [Rikenellaceae bacterium]